MDTMTDAELIELGKKVLERRRVQREKSKERGAIKRKLYDLWKAGDKTPVGDIKL